MELYVGTSGFSFKEWKGLFYPADLPDKKMLQYYGGQFKSVEINNTFHRMPKLSVLEGWAEEVPEQFRFVIKAPQQITHFLRLKECDDPVSYLIDTAGCLEQRLGAVFFLLPPTLKKDLALLHDFLALLPPGRRFAFEFRHQSWFDDDVFDLLHRNDAALCIADAENDLEVPFAATAKWGYLRLRRPDYPDRELESWVGRVLGQKWREAYVFFKHEDEAKGPLLARKFLQLAAAPSPPGRGPG